MTSGVSDLQRADAVFSGLAVGAMLLLHFLFRPTLAEFSAALAEALRAQSAASTAL